MLNNNLTLQMLDILDFEPEQMHLREICDRMNGFMIATIRTFDQQEQLAEDF